jgi:hypothetical protein
MDARFYNADDLDIEQLAANLENIYRAQGYQTQQIGNNNQVMVQLKKGSDFEALIGLQAALSVIIQHSGGGVIAMIGQQRWIDKAAVGAVGILAAPVLWPLMLTAGAGAIRQASLGNQVLNVVDGLVRQQRPEIQIGPVPVQIMPQIQQQWVPGPQSTPPAYLPPGYNQVPQYTPPPQVVNALPYAPPAQQKLRCPTCNTPYDPGDTFCTGCGKPLVTLCPKCKTEVKENTAFCPKCGASLFQSSSDTFVAQPTQQSAPAPQQTPVYTPPPTPPAQQRQAPVYTPPPEPQPYVPPTPQEPAEQPKTTVTYIPATPNQGTPPAPKQQPRHDVPYYTPPPVNPQQVSPKPKTPAQPTPAAAHQPIQARPSSQAPVNANAVWGSLTLSDGKEVKLSGEHAIVGRSDHDIGDIQPEVDLSTAQGSDTVSRIHAALEHIGSAYTVTDLNSTNATRLNGKRLEPDKATPINEGDTLTFGKVTATFKKA